MPELGVSQLMLDNSQNQLVISVFVEQYFRSMGATVEAVCLSQVS